MRISYSSKSLISSRSFKSGKDAGKSERQDFLLSLLLYLVLILVVASPFILIGKAIGDSRSHPTGSADSISGNVLSHGETKFSSVQPSSGDTEDDLKIFNTKSNPVLGGLWIIHFRTEGKSLLIISGNDTVFNQDVELKGIFCGGLRNNYSISGVHEGRISGAADRALYDSISIDGWSCDSDAYVVLREMTKGKHTFSLSFMNHTGFAENAAAGATQLSDYLYQNMLKFNFTTNHFNNSANAFEVLVSGPTRRSAYVAIPKTSKIDIMNARVSFSGGISAVTRTTSTNIKAIAGGNLTYFDGKEIVVATTGDLAMYYNPVNWTRNWSISGLSMIDVVVGKISTVDPGEQVLYAAQRNLTLVRGMNGSRIWSKQLPSNIVAISLANLNGDALNDSVAVTSTGIYAFAASGTPLWNKTNVGVDITDVAAGKLTGAYANDQIEIVSTTTQNATILNSAGTIIQNTYKGYNMRTNSIGRVNYSKSYEDVREGKDDGSNLMTVIALGEVFPSNANGEVISGWSDGTKGGHVVVSDLNGTELWDYDTESGAITALTIADVTSDSGNEILIGTDNKEWFVQNHNYYPSNVVFNISDIKRYNKSTGLFTSVLNNLNLSSNLTHALTNHCSGDLCNVSFTLQASGTGLLRLSALFVRYEYDVSDRMSFTSSYSFNTTRNMIANATYMFYHRNITFTKPIQDNLVFRFIEVSSGATVGAGGCYFAGKSYPVTQVGMTKFCNLTPDTYQITANGLIPPSSYLWDNSMTRTKALYYRNYIRSNPMEWNHTYNLSSNSSRALINASLFINITDGNSTYRFNNETVYVKIGSTRYNITPSAATSECYLSPSTAEYTQYPISGTTYYTCMSDKDNDGYVDLVRIKISSMPAYSKMNFTVRRYANKFPYVSNSILRMNTIPWNRTQQFNVTFNDVESNNVNVSLYVRYPGGQYQKRGNLLVASGAVAPFNVSIPSSWIGTVNYYYNFSDFSGTSRLHPWITSAPLAFTVRAHYVNLTVFTTNNTRMNRSNGLNQIVKIYALLTDLDNMSSVDSSTKGQLHIGGLDRLQITVNRTGYLIENFDPDNQYSVGPNAWYFSIEDNRYFYNRSKTYNLYIYGDIITYPPVPYLVPPGDGTGTVSRAAAQYYPNTINWTFDEIVTDAPEDLTGSADIYVYWRDVLRDSCTIAGSCSRKKGQMVVPTTTPLFMNDDYLSIWINKTWYNPYHYISDDYLVYEQFDFVNMTPPNRTIVYRTAGYRNDKINFSVKLMKNNTPIVDASIKFVTDLGNCGLVYNYSGTYNCSYNPPDTAYPKRYNWWAVAQNGGGLGDDRSKNMTFDLYAVVNLSKMRPANNTLINATRNFIYCNVTDYFLPKASPAYRIANKTVKFYNGTRYIGSNKTNSTGVARITWDTSTLTKDAYFNVVCNITNETASNHKVYGNYQRITHRYLVDYFEQLFVQNLLQPGSNVSRRYTTKSPSLINLTVNVTQFVNSTYLPVTGARVSFNISGDSYPPNCVGGVKEGTGGLYYCTYNPTDSMTLGLHNWTANASKAQKTASAKSSRTTIRVRGFASVNFLNSSADFYRTSNPVFKARLIDDANNSLSSTTFTCGWYVDGQFKSTTSPDATGHCIYLWPTGSTCAANVSAGLHNISVNITGSDINYYKQKNRDSGIVTLRDTSFNLTILSPAPFQKMSKVSVYPLTVSVKDNCGYNLPTFTVNWTRFSISNGTSAPIAVVNNAMYSWTISNKTYIGPTQIIANVSVPYTSRVQKTILVDIYGYSNIYGATDVPDVNNYLEGDVITVRCNVSDKNLLKNEYGFNITGHNVSFARNGTYKFSNVSNKGIVLFHWNTMGQVNGSTYHNLTCTLNAYAGFNIYYNRTLPFTSWTLVHIDALKSMSISLVGPVNNTNVSRYNQDYYRSHTANLSVYVSSSGLPVSSAVINWTIPAGSCEQTSNHGNGYYSCRYNPQNNITPGKYNWTAKATAYTYRPANTTSKRTLNIYGMLVANSTNQYTLRRNVMSIRSDLIDENNKTSSALYGQRIRFYINNILKAQPQDGTDDFDLDGHCWYTFDARRQMGGCQAYPIGYPVGNYTLNTTAISTLPYYDSQYRNRSYVLTIKDDNITTSIEQPILNSIHMRNNVLTINSTINDSCGPILAHNTTWYDNGTQIGVGDDTTWGIPIPTVLGRHNLTARVRGPFYITKNTSRAYNVYAYSNVTFVAPIVANVSHDSNVFVKCYVQETDSRNRVVGYPVNLTENGMFVSTNTTAFTGNATLRWHPMIIGARTVSCLIWNYATYIPLPSTSSRSINVIDTTAPTIRSAAFKPATGYVNYMNFSLNATVYDLVNTTRVWFRFYDSGKSIVRIVNLTKMIEINATTDYYAKNITFTQYGTYAVTAYATDAAGNVRNSSLGIMNVHHSAWGAMNLSNSGLFNISNITRNSTFSVSLEINLTNYNYPLSAAPMFNTNLTLSVPKGFMLNISNHTSVLNRTFATSLSDFRKNSVSRQNMTIRCSRIDNGSKCRISLNLTILPNATSGNNSILLFFRWKNPSNNITVQQKNIRILVQNNTVVRANTDLQTSLISPGYPEPVANFTLMAFGNTNLTNVSMKVIPSGSFPTLMKDSWFTFTPWKNKSNVTKLSDIKINVTMNIPSSNYTYEVMNYHYPSTSWTYITTLRINLTGNKNICRKQTNCYYDIPMHITVGASHWDILDYDIVNQRKITKKVAYNQTDRLGYIRLFNYRTQSNGEIDYSILRSGTAAPFLYFSPASDRIDAAKSKDVPVYYSTNSTIGKFNGTIVFDAASGAISPNTLNVTILLEILPMKAQLLKPTEDSKVRNVREGDILNMTGKVYFNVSSVSDNITFAFNISGMPAEIQSQSYDPVSGNWSFRVIAPHITNNPIYNWIRFEGLYNDTLVFDFQNNTLIYEDVLPPNFTQPYVDFISPGQDASLKIIIKDNSKVNETYVDITYPTGNITRYNFTSIAGDVYTLNLTNLSRGDYHVRFVAFDNHTINRNGTFNLSFRNVGNYSWWFGVYNKTTLSGKVNDRENRGKTGNIVLLNPGTISENLFNIPINPSGVYNAQIHKRKYALDMNLTGSMRVFLHLNSTSFENSSTTYDFMDVDSVENLNGYKINSRKVYKIIAISSKVTSSGKIAIGYADVVLDDLSKTFIFACPAWNFAGQNCTSTWTKIDSRQFVSLYDDTYIQSAITLGASSAFALVDDTPPIEQQPQVQTNQKTNMIDPDALRAGLEKKLNESRQQILNETKAILDPYNERLSSFSDFNKKYGLNLEEIQRIIYQGENLSMSLYLKNPEKTAKQVKIEVSENLRGIFRISKTEFELQPSAFVGTDFTLYASNDFRPGLYSGYIFVRVASDSIMIPVNIRVMEPDALRVQMNINAIDDTVSIGKNLGLNLDLYNPAGDEKNILVTFEIYDLQQNLRYKTNKTYVLKSYLNTVATFDLPMTLPVGEYFVKTKASYDENGFTREFSKVTRFKVVLPLLQRTLFGVPVWYFLAALGIASAIYAGTRVRVKFKESRRRYRLPVIFKEIPLLKSLDKIFLGKLSEYDKDVYFDTDNLSMHTIVAGSTGGGKTVAAQGIVEEALNKKIGVVVFDPTAQWTGFFRKNTDKNMQQYYAKFGMRTSDARSYPGKILVIEDPLEKINLERHLVPGEITVFSLHKLTPKEIDLFVASTVKQVFSLGLDETSSLKYLLVYDEVHRLLPKFGGTGAGFIQIERAAREFRKWGLGLVLISQVLSDFIGEIKANINTEIQMRTKDENDLERLKSKYGEEVLKSVVKAETGNGMLTNPSYNKGKPFMVNFKPLLHSPHRLTESELNKYVKYSEEIDEVAYNVNRMKSQSVDVFDLELELKLAKEKLSSGSFTMVEIYLEGLNARLSETLSKNNIPRQKVVLEKVDMDELREEIDRARKLRAASKHDAQKGSGETSAVSSQSSGQSFGQSGMPSGQTFGQDRRGSYSSGAYAPGPKGPRILGAQGYRSGSHPGQSPGKQRGVQAEDVEESADYTDKLFAKLQKRSDELHKKNALQVKPVGLVMSNDAQDGKIASKDAPYKVKNAQQSQSLQQAKKAEEKPIELRDENAPKIKELSDRLDTLRHMSDTLKRRENLRGIDIGIKYVESDINALKRHYVEQYYQGAKDKIARIEQDLRIYSQIPVLREKARASMQKGAKEPDIRRALSAKGWPKRIIDDIFERL